MAVTEFNSASLHESGDFNQWIAVFRSFIVRSGSCVSVISLDVCSYGNCSWKVIFHEIVSIACLDALLSGNMEKNVLLFWLKINFSGFPDIFPGSA